jgi:tetratricopeptide (TPR) repeat protein
MVLFLEKRYAAAEPVYRRALAIWERAAGGEAMLATSLDNLAVVLSAQEKYAEAEPLYVRSTGIREQAAAESLNNLGLVLSAQDKNRASEAAYRLAAHIAERMPPGMRAAVLATTLENYSALLLKLKRTDEARRLRDRARALAPKKR